MMEARARDAPLPAVVATPIVSSPARTRRYLTAAHLTPAHHTCCLAPTSGLAPRFGVGAAKPGCYAHKFSRSERALWQRAAPRRWMDGGASACLPPLLPSFCRLPHHLPPPGTICYCRLPRIAARTATTCRSSACRHLLLLPLRHPPPSLLPSPADHLSRYSE